MLSSARPNELILLPRNLLCSPTGLNDGDGDMLDEESNRNILDPGPEGVEGDCD